MVSKDLRTSSTTLITDTWQSRAKVVSAGHSTAHGATLHGGPKGLRGLKNSLSSKIAGATAKRKVVVDLTDDDETPPERNSASIAETNVPRKLFPATVNASTHQISGRHFGSQSAVISMSEDERLARELHAQYEREDAADQTATNSKLDAHCEQDSDALYALQLQAEFDFERVSMSTDHASSTQACKSQLEPSSDVICDRALAQQLQAEFDREHATVSIPSTLAQTSAADPVIDPHADRRMVQKYGEAIRHVSCGACGKPCISSESDLVLKQKAWLEQKFVSTIFITSLLPCTGHMRKCNAVTCIGCGQVSRPGASYTVRSLDNGMTLTWCCSKGRMALIWMLLCGHDKRHTVERRRDAHFKKSSLMRGESSGASVAGVGYGGSQSHGYNPFAAAAPTINAGKYSTYNFPCDVPGTNGFATAPKSSTNSEDKLNGRLMAAMEVLLPSLVADELEDFDIVPHAALPALLTQSRFLATIASLLRNDSLEDATKRMRLYQTTLNVVNKLGSHHETAPRTIHSDRQEEDGGPNILALSFSTVPKSEKAKFEKSQSLASCLNNFDKQSKNMLASARAQPDAFCDVESQHMLMLCTKVSDLADFLLANKAELKAKAEEQPQNDNWHADLAVVELPDEVISAGHHFVSEARQAQNLAPGRMKALSMQLSTLMTSLPSGIFIRHGVSRLDMMKILIVGPKGTPYENGLFEFDLFCPSTFPNSPPKMVLRTTGQGRIRFNPNLYNCGKGTLCPRMTCLELPERTDAILQYVFPYSGLGQVSHGKPASLRSSKSSSPSKP
jgi:hypothetical protein